MVTSVRIDGGLSEIQTKHLSNTGLEHYYCAKPLGIKYIL